MDTLGNILFDTAYQVPDFWDAGRINFMIDDPLNQRIISIANGYHLSQYCPYYLEISYDGRRIRHRYLSELNYFGVRGFFAKPNGEGYWVLSDNAKVDLYLVDLDSTGKYLGKRVLLHYPPSGDVLMTQLADSSFAMLSWVGVNPETARYYHFDRNGNLLTSDFMRSQLYGMFLHQKPDLNLLMIGDAFLTLDTAFQPIDSVQGVFSIYDSIGLGSGFVRIARDGGVYGITPFYRGVRPGADFNDFFVFKTDSNYYLDKSERLYLTTGIKETTPSTKSRIFPNPASGKLTIAGQPNVQYLEIYNLLGEYVATVRVQQQEADVHEIPQGLYYLKGKDAKGAYLNLGTLMIAPEQ